MIFKEGLIVVLPTQEMPWIFDGKEQPLHITSVFVTPDGFFPRMVDLTNIYGRSKRELAYQKMKSTEERFKKWYRIDDPSVEQLQEALDNVNDKYQWLHEKKDNCVICNAIDDSLFNENCWLIDTDHKCGDTGPLADIKIRYSFKSRKYKVILKNWLAGVSPHLEGDHK